MLALWSLVGLDDIHAMSALRTLLSALLNTVAFTAFAAAHAIAWRPGLLMATTDDIGATARRIPFRKRLAAEAGAGEVRAVRFQPRRVPSKRGDAGFLALLHQKAGPGRLAGDVVLGEAVVLVGRQ